jgi:hypothetical protein
VRPGSWGRNALLDLKGEVRTNGQGILVPGNGLEVNGNSLFYSLECFPFTLAVDVKPL